MASGFPYKARALFKYDAVEASELSVAQGDIVEYEPHRSERVIGRVETDNPDGMRVAGVVQG
jgi:hypothetical protein